MRSCRRSAIRWIVHTKIEEAIFYPPARAALKRAGEDLLDEAVVEHEGIKWRIQLLKTMKPTDDLYDAEVKVLAEYVRHHVKEEERELFPKLGWSDFDNAGVGEQLAAMKEKLTGKRVKPEPSLLERGIEGPGRPISRYRLAQAVGTTFSALGCDSRQILSRRAAAKPGRTSP